MTTRTARRITPEDPPQFPCWLWNAKDNQWRNCRSNFPDYMTSQLIAIGFTHWHAHRPTPPAPVSEAQTIAEAANTPDKDKQAVAASTTVPAPDSATPRTNAADTPLANQAAKAIGYLAASWKEGKIDAVQFARRADAFFDVFRDVERELAAARQEMERLRNASNGLGYATTEELQKTLKTVERLLDFEKEVAQLHADLAAARADSERLKGLLVSAQKWLRMIDERRDEIPGWFRHDADPRPLIKAIDAARNIS